MRMLAMPKLPERSAPKMLRSEVVVCDCTIRLSEFAPPSLKAFCVTLAAWNRPNGVTPFALFQAASVSQNGFNEGGANSLSLIVQSQTTTSLRTIFGADLSGSIGIGNMRMLDLDFRLGWQHDYANTARPITASFAGAPGNAFTVYGATPATDSAVVGFSAKSQIADNAQLYLRYDGQIATGTDNHALNVGVRFTW